MRRWAGVLGVATSVLLGCGSPSDGGNGALFGLWRQTHGAGTDSCSGDYDSDAQPSPLPYRIRLRPAGSGYLEYVTLDQLAAKQERATCIQRFSITGSTAAILPNQDCELLSSSTIPDSGATTIRRITQIFSDDQLTLTGDSLHEVGQLEYETAAGPCHATFSVDYARVSGK